MEVMPAAVRESYLGTRCGNQFVRGNSAMQNKPAFLPNPNLIILLHALFKVLPLPICGLSIYLGYRLFVLGVTGQASLSISTGKVSGQLLNAAPGIFFMLGGIAATAAIIYKGMDVLYSPSSVMRYGDVNPPNRYDGLLRVKFQRTDRSPGPDHNYGDTIDAVLDHIAGGPNILDRTAHLPTARIMETGAILELHEDGPEVEMMARDILTFLDTSIALLNSWNSWTPPAGEFGERDVRVTVGEYVFTGKPSKTDLQRILEFYCELAAGFAEDEKSQMALAIASAPHNQG